MAASHHRWSRGVLAAGALLVAATVSGCASHGAENIKIPDQSMLDPATEAMDEAVSSNADQLAPHIIGNARRRVAVARDILFEAARANRSLSPDDRERVEELVEQARLDARAALTKAQAEDVMRQLEQFQTGGDEPMTDGPGPVAPGSAPGSGMADPGPGAPGPGAEPGGAPAPEPDPGRGPGSEDDQMQAPGQGMESNQGAGDMGGMP